MTLPIFNLGDEVEVIGTDRYGNDTDKMKFTIVMMWSDDGKTFYSDRYSPWYPANSLRLVNEKPLSPMQVTCTYDPVDCECRAIQVSCPCGRKAEIAVPDELKIGDWVEVILTDNPFTGKIGKVSSVGELTVALYDMGIWSRDSLRKLTPEEVAKHTAPKLELSQETKVKIGMTLLKQLDQIGEVRDRLTAIEKRQDIQGDRLNTIDLEKDDLRKRLAFVEKIQHDQDDLVGRAIRDGVAEILDFRRKA